MARTKSVLGDVRRDERAEWMLERIVASGSLVLRALGGTRSGEMAAHRLLSSDDVDPTTLLTPHVARTAAACNGRRVVAVQDTTEINFDRHRRPATGLGPTGTTKYAAFSFIPSWPWTPMTKRCSAWREHGSGRAAGNPHPHHNNHPF